MSYKEDLRKINAALRDPNSRCYDPLAGKSPINTQERKVANRRRLQRARCVMRWRKRNRIKYRAYMRRYMAERRAAMKIAGKVEVGVQGPHMAAEMNLFEEKRNIAVDIVSGGINER